MSDKHERADSLGIVSWILLGLSAGLGALMLGAGLWNSPVEVVASGVAIAGGLAGVVALIDSKSGQDIVVAGVIAVILSLISGVWFVEDLRNATLNHVGSILPEGALHKAYETESSAVAVSACASLIAKETADRGMIRLFEQRPGVTASCLVAPGLEEKERQQNIRRRMSRLWHQELLAGTSVKGCELVGPLEVILAEESSGTQRLLLIALTSPSEQIRACTADSLESRLTALSDLRFIGALGPTDALGTEEARNLHTALTSNQLSNSPRIDLSKHRDLMNGWSLQLSCRQDLIPYPEVRSAVGGFLGQSDCGSFDSEQSRAVWNRVCVDLVDVSIREATEKACTLTSHWAREEAQQAASQKLQAALRAHRQTDTTMAIYSADGVSARDAPYEERFGTEQMKRMLDDSGTTPLVRQQIMRDMVHVQRQSRGMTRDELEAMKDVEDPEGLQRTLDQNMDRVRQLSASEDLDLEAILEERGVELGDDEKAILDRFKPEPE